ncbi:hypothetical protein, partial [Burkholderia pseudomallei]|uniref:hypothetical protein n=1 Tax=Burkholderia pseudomallei TaxID=28450 RepID=UPI001AAF9A58
MTRIARAAPVASFIEAILRLDHRLTASLPHCLTASPPHRRPRAQRNHADRSSAPPDSIDACARPSPTA